MFCRRWVLTCQLRKTPAFKLWGRVQVQPWLSAVKSANLNLSHVECKLEEFTFNHSLLLSSQGQIHVFWSSYWHFPALSSTFQQFPALNCIFPHFNSNHLNTIWPQQPRILLLTSSSSVVEQPSIFSWGSCCTFQNRPAPFSTFQHV
jgi:hypothetical protein